jgi:3-dehydroquinate dehydratase II
VIAQVLVLTGPNLGLSVDVRQNDDERELISWVREAADARLVEVHISNPAARESFRHTPVVAAVADGTVAGSGLVWNQLALQAIAELAVEDAAQETPAP